MTCAARTSTASRNRPLAVCGNSRIVAATMTATSRGHRRLASPSTLRMSILSSVDGPTAEARLASAQAGLATVGSEPNRGAEIGIPADSLLHWRGEPAHGQRRLAGVGSSPGIACVLVSVGRHDESLRIFLDWLGGVGAALTACASYISSGGRKAPKVVLDAMAVLVVGPGSPYRCIPSGSRLTCSANSCRRTACHLIFVQDN